MLFLLEGKLEKKLKRILHQPTRLTITSSQQRLGISQELAREKDGTKHVNNLILTEKDIRLGSF